MINAGNAVVHFIKRHFVGAIEIQFIHVHSILSIIYSSVVVHIITCKEADESTQSNYSNVSPVHFASCKCFSGRHNIRTSATATPQSTNSCDWWDCRPQPPISLCRLPSICRRTFLRVSSILILQLDMIPHVLQLAYHILRVLIQRITYCTRHNPLCRPLQRRILHRTQHLQRSRRSIRLGQGMER